MMLKFNDALNIINKEIDNISYPQNPKSLYDPIQYILSLKGKKIRPVLCLLGCNLYKENIQNAINPALAWEIFHNFTLMHDDLMDKAEMRRGKPVVYKVWGENAAILSGDSMLILAYQYMAKNQGNNLSLLMDLFSTTAMEICEGQQFDMEFEKRLDVSVDEYLNMIRLKTAVLLGASLKTGAIIGGASAEDADLLCDFGVNIGLAFQIKDDLLDVYGDPKIFGKQIGGDILCNKKTFLLITALNNAEGTVKEDLLNWISIDNNVNSENKIKAVTDIYNQLNVSRISEEKIASYFERSIASLNAVSVSEEKKDILRDFAKELMQRQS